MNFDLSDEQKMLAEQADNLLAERSPYHRLRELIDMRAQWDENLWREFGEMGFLGARIPEDFGGLGLSHLDLGVISQSLGRANAALPFFSSIVCAADAVALAGSDAQKAKWLPRLASGEAVGCFAYGEGQRGWRPATPDVVVRDGRIDGTKTPVADAGLADVAVVMCAHEGGPALAIVELNQTEIAREHLDSFDELRAYSRLTFSGAQTEILPGATSALIDTVFDRIAVQQAFENVGAAEACIHMARDYAMDRNIFGRSLASYQAIKHTLADCLLQTEFARANAYFAAWAAQDAPDSLPGAAAAARLSALNAFEGAARENLQIHGGIGYTFEADCHFYYRRERANALSLGPKQYWADRLIAHMPGEQGEAA